MIGISTAESCNCIIMMRNRLPANKSTVYTIYCRLLPDALHRDAIHGVELGALLTIVPAMVAHLLLYQL